MKKTLLRKLVKECIESVFEEFDQYDPETDTMAPGPRDRMSGEENDLNIPEFPQSVIKQHNMDGQQRWFVYSSADPQALIIGWGKSFQNAVHNAKTTAKYIKHGGVGHVGELKESDINNSERNYDEKTEMKKINDILVVCEHAFKRSNDVTYFPLVLRQIQKICLELLKMHGAK